jgi:hypothetical protein
MPSYTVAELRALTLRKLRQSDTSRYSLSKGTADYGWIDDEIELAEEEFVRLSKCLRTYAIVQLKTNIRVYRLPSDFIDLMAAYYYHSSLAEGYKELVVTTIEKLNDDASDWRSATGTPNTIYIDRKHGKGEVLGLYYIPSADGAAITFANANAEEVEWLCPLYYGRTDFGRVVRYGSDDSYVLSTSDTELVDAEVSDGNLLLEYYRLPIQRDEIPPEANQLIPTRAAGKLLSDMPEDSAEYKRSMALEQQFMDGVQTYINRRKRSLSGQELQSKAMVWGWQKGFQHNKDLP